MDIIKQKLDSDPRIEATVKAVNVAKRTFNPFRKLVGHQKNEAVLYWLLHDMERHNRMGNMVDGDTRRRKEIQAVEKLGLVTVQAQPAGRFFMQPTDKLLTLLEERCITAAQAAPLVPHVPKIKGILRRLKKFTR